MEDHLIHSYSNHTIISINAVSNLVFAMSTGMEAAVVMSPLIILAMKCRRIFSWKYPEHTHKHSTILTHRQPQLLSVFNFWAIHMQYHTGWPQSMRRKFLSFPGFSTAISLLFHRLSQQKVNVIMIFINGHDDPVYPVNSCFTKTLHKYLNDELKILCLLQFFPEVVQNSLSFPRSEISRNPWVFQVCGHPVST